MGLVVIEVDVLVREISRSIKEHPIALIIALFIVAAITIIAGFGINV